MNESIPIALNGLPYWRVTFRPSVYRADRITSPNKCLDALESIAVRAGGWRYPFVSRDRDRMHLRKDHAEAFVDSGEYREFTRLYRSGQFMYVTALREAFGDGPMQEAREIRRFSNPRGGKEPTGGVNIVRMMRLVSVAYLNISSLIEKLHLEEPIELSLKLSNVRGRVLVAGPQRELDEYYQMIDDSIELDEFHTPEDVRVKPLELALSAARSVYARFGWIDPLDIVLDGIQEQALK